MEDIFKIKKSLEDSGLLLKEVTETVQNEVKEQKGGFLISMLFGTSSASFLRNILTGLISLTGINRAAEGIVRASYGNKKGRKNDKSDF